MKFLHLFGLLALVSGVGMLESGAVPLINGFALGLSGGALMIATMKKTGWYV